MDGRMSKASRPVALVTGGGRGIGKTIALTLAGRGCRVAVNERSPQDPAAETVSEIIAQGGEAMAVYADVGANAEVARMVDEVVARFGQLDILVNNAGVQTWKSL